MQQLVPLAALDALQFPLQPLVSVLVVPDLLGDGGAIARVQLGDELRNEVGVLGGFLGGGQTGAGRLPLPRALDLSGGRRVWRGILALAPDLILQDEQIEVAQRIGAQAAALEALVGGDVGVVLQQLRDPAEDRGAYAIGMEGLEQQERLEVGVGGEASIHPPVPLDGVLGTRATTLGRQGSQHDGGERAKDACRQRRAPREMAQAGG